MNSGVRKKADAATRWHSIGTLLLLYKVSASLSLRAFGIKFRSIEMRWY